ncbi:MAG: hypothetical protein JHC91_02900 [Chloroflexi bacterium]|nr:hypothetical protein [Chloroflexota bacterium]
MQGYGERQGVWLGLLIGGLALGLLLALLLTAVDLADCDQRYGVISRWNDDPGPRYEDVYPAEFEAWVRECRD